MPKNVIQRLCAWLQPLFVVIWTTLRSWTKRHPRLLRLLLCAPAPILAALACNVSSEPPATLQVRISTPIPTPIPAVRATSTPPVGIADVRPVDPSILALMSEVQNDRLMYAMSSLVAMQTRHVLSAKDDPQRGIGAARDWLLAQFDEIQDAHPDRHIDVWTQPVQFTWRTLEVRSENIVVVLPGQDVGGGVIVVGAHYDSAGADLYDGISAAPGANDNASGVAALLEIAHIMARSPHRATLVFVAFTAEESGRQGSMTFVQDYLQAQNPPIAIRGMINLDTLGSEQGSNRQRDPRTLRLFSAEPNESPSRAFARQMALAINLYATDVNLVMQSAEERTGRWGDQQSFSQAGYASARLIQGLEDPNRQHSPDDTLENIQLDYLMRVTRAALAAVAVLADGPSAPVPISLRPSADVPGALTFTWGTIPDAAGYLVALRRTPSLYYDQILTVVPGNASSLTWESFGSFHVLSIAAIDSQGRVGAFSPEMSIATLTRR